MGAYLIRRVFSGLVTLFGITFVTFLVITLAPGDPAELQAMQMKDAAASQRLYEELRAYYDLDKPLVQQYGIWLGRLARADLGNSFHDSLPVTRKIGDAIWPTLSVAILSFLLTYLIAIPLGVYSAGKANSWFDRISSVVVYVLYSIPSYVLAMLLILYLGVQLDLLPFSGMRSDGYAEMSLGQKILDLAKHYVLITISFTAGSLAYYSRFTRQNLLEIVRQDYIRTARAYGFSEHVILWRYALPNALIPLITLMALTFPFALSGSVILETMFNWPGMGRLFFESVLRRDYPTVMGLSVITASLVLVSSLIADLAYGIVDPRVRYGGADDS